MQGKKGVQVGINSITVIILGIVIFMGGMSLFYTMFDESVQTFCDLDEKAEERLIERYNDGSSVFAWPDTVKVGESSPFCEGNQADLIFHVGVNNPGPEQTFNLTVNVSDDSLENDVNFTYLGFDTIAQGETSTAIVAGTVSESLESDQRHTVVARVYDENENEHGVETVRLET